MEVFKNKYNFIIFINSALIAIIYFPSVFTPFYSYEIITNYSLILVTNTYKNINFEFQFISDSE